MEGQSDTPLEKNKIVCGERRGKPYHIDFDEEVAGLGISEARDLELPSRRDENPSMSSLGLSAFRLQ